MCDCRKSDAWRCAVDKNLVGQVACRCACHEYPPPPEKKYKDSAIRVGDTVKSSPMGNGVVTGISDAGYPQVNHVAVSWLERDDGIWFNPHGFDKDELLAEKKG